MAIEDGNTGQRTGRKDNDVDNPGSDHQRLHEPDDLSRRDALRRLGAGGLFPIAAALLARSITTPPTTAARDTPPAETPAPLGSGAPPGVEYATLTVHRFDVTLTAPFDFIMSRAVLQPGASFPVGAGTAPSIIFIEEGVAVCPGDAGRTIIGRDLTTREAGAGDVVLVAGEALYSPPGVADGLRN